ncbi:hypothetical protein, partial [Nocardioides guangzhouensis]|uniref:hypothetical protein n=1 Tax=Nocardioides guangzhouensis TaxID=2497878 RepID=UPI001C379395
HKSRNCSRMTGRRHPGTVTALQLQPYRMFWRSKCVTSPQLQPCGRSAGPVSRRAAAIAPE